MHNEDSLKVARKISRKFPKHTAAREQKGSTQFDNSNLELSKIYKFRSLLLHEILVYHRCYNIIIHNIQFLLLGMICLLFVCPSNYDKSVVGMIFLISGLPISIIASSAPIIKNDLEDGNLELYLVTSDINIIVLSKFFALLFCNFISFTIAVFIMAFLYNMTYHQIFLLYSSSILLIQISGISLLISSVESYFRGNISMISSLIVPLILPSLIIAGLMLHSDLSYYSGVTIVLAITCIITPIILLFSGYLIRNIHNF